MESFCDKFLKNSSHCLIGYSANSHDPPQIQSYVAGLPLSRHGSVISRESNPPSVRDLRTALRTSAVHLLVSAPSIPRTRDSQLPYAGLS